MPERNRTLRNIFKIQGPILTLIGVSWLAITTQSRLDGVLWLEDFLSWIPGPTTVDMEIGIGWIICGILVTLGGFLGRKFKVLENAGFIAVLCWPVAMALVYIFAMATGYAPNGINSSLAYLAITAPYVGFMLWPQRDWKISPAVASEVNRVRQEAIDSES